jgi:hypothetical protein
LRYDPRLDFSSGLPLKHTFLIRAADRRPASQIDELRYVHEDSAVDISTRSTA